MNNLQQMEKSLTIVNHTLIDTDELAFLDEVFSKLTEELQGRIGAMELPPEQYDWEAALQGRTGGRRPKSGRGATPPSKMLATGKGASSTTPHSAELVGIAGQRNFLIAEQRGLCRLSADTRIREEKRLNKKLAREKGKREYKMDGRKKRHWQKVRAKKEFNNKRWEKAPLERLKYSSRKPVHITQDEWDRCIAPVWNQYDRKYLKVRGGADSYTIHNLILEYHPPKERYSRKTPKPVVVYDGYSQAVYDSMTA